MRAADTFLAVVVGPAEPVAILRRRAMIGAGAALGRLLVRL